MNKFDEHPSKNSVNTVSAVTQKKLKSEELFQGEKELVVQHAGGEYKLRITRQNKLILTK